MFLCRWQCLNASRRRVLLTALILYGVQSSIPQKYLLIAIHVRVTPFQAALGNAEMSLSIGSKGLRVVAKRFMYKWLEWKEDWKYRYRCARTKAVSVLMDAVSTFAFIGIFDCPISSFSLWIKKAGDWEDLPPLEDSCKIEFLCLHS